MFKGEKTYNIIYYSGKYIFTMLLLMFPINMFVKHNFLVPLLLIFVDYFVLKKCIIEALEDTDDFKIKKKDMEVPFMGFTALFLIICGFIFSYNIIGSLILAFIHMVIFKEMDANNERRIEEANKAIDEYFMKKGKKK